MSRNTLPFDLNRDKLVLLLKRLTQGMLEVNDANELKDLLQKKIKNARKNKDDLYEKQLSELIAIIDSYSEGEINLSTFLVIKTTTTLKYDIQKHNQIFEFVTLPL